MTKDEMEQLAELIANKIMEKQKIIDEAFFIDLNDAIDKGAEVTIETEEDILLGELARLNTILAQLEERDEFEKAAIVANKIKYIENKISRL